MCSLPKSERPVDLPPGMMGKILISSSGEPLVQAGSEDIPAEESMVTNAVMMAELEGITPVSGYDGGKNLMNPQPMEVEESPVAGKDIPDDSLPSSTSPFPLPSFSSHSPPPFFPSSFPFFLLFSPIFARFFFLPTSPLLFAASFPLSFPSLLPSFPFFLLAGPKDHRHLVPPH